MENIKIELELDQLQEIAISNVVAEYKRTRYLAKSRDKSGTKAKEMQALSETTNRKINAF
jgi:hypothetical protein